MASVQPFDGDLPFFRVDAQDDPAGVAAARLDDELAVLQGRRAEDDPADTHFEIVLHGPKFPDSASQFNGNADGGQYLPDDPVVDGTAFAGAVEIDDVNTVGPLCGPPAGHFNGIPAVDGLPLEVPLQEPDALAAP